MGREDLEPRVVGRDEHDEHPIGPVLRGERDRGLVPVVAVGDQELPRPEERLHPLVALDAPEPGPVDVDIGLRGRSRERRRALVEEEDGLELRARRAQEAKAAGERLGVRPLVRQNDARGVRLDAERGHDPVAPPCDTVGTDEVLLEEPDRGRRVADECPVVEPALESLRRGVLVRLGGEVDDVVRVSCPERLARVGVDHVVRRRRHLRARPCVADGAERADVGHRSSVQVPERPDVG